MRLPLLSREKKKKEKNKKEKEHISFLFIYSKKTCSFSHKRLPILLSVLPITIEALVWAAPLVIKELSFIAAAHAGGTLLALPDCG